MTDMLFLHVGCGGAKTMWVCICQKPGFTPPSLAISYHQDIRRRNNFCVCGGGGEKNIASNLPLSAPPNREQQAPMAPRLSRGDSGEIRKFSKKN
jgi:hypothetical protein